MVFAYRGIISYQGIELSLERALRRALPGYAEAYQWFIDNEGYVGPRPYGKHAPIGIKLKLAAQRGIQKPGGKQNIYALSVTSTDREVYASDSVSHLDDGYATREFAGPHSAARELSGPNRAELAHGLRSDRGNSRPAYPQTPTAR